MCDPAFPGSTPSNPRCTAGASTRYFDAAFVRAGLGAGRLGQLNMIGTTNESKFDSWTTTVRGRTGRALVSLSYVLANSRAWGRQPVASYSGNGIAISPDDQFRESAWGPTRLDERHRIVASGVIDLPMKVYGDLFNVFNTENLSFILRPEQSAANVGSSFLAAGLAVWAGVRPSGGPTVHRLLRGAPGMVGPTVT